MIELGSPITESFMHLIADYMNMAVYRRPGQPIKKRVEYVETRPILKGVRPAAGDECWIGCIFYLDKRVIYMNQKVVSLNNGLVPACFDSVEEMIEHETAKVRFLILAEMASRGFVESERDIQKFNI